MPPVFTPILLVSPPGHADTHRVAKEIAAILREEALDTDMYELDRLPSLDGYRAVVLGGCLDDNAWEDSSGRFLTHNRTRLVSLPVAVFALASGADHADLTHERHMLLQELSRCRWLHPIAAEVFRASPDNGRGTSEEMMADAGEVQTWARLVAHLLTPVAAR